jgi:hypothetical protein
MTEGGEQTTAPAGEAAVPASPAPHIVHVAERCEGSPHAYDVITLREHATLRMGAAVTTVLKTAMGDDALVEAGLAMEFLRWGIADWTFVETVAGRQRPVYIGEPVDRDVLERWLPFSNGGLEVMEAAAGLYGDVLTPFVRRLSTLSQAGLGGTSTSATNGSGGTHRKRSKRSSPPATAGPKSG